MEEQTILEEEGQRRGGCEVRGGVKEIGRFVITSKKLSITFLTSRQSCGGRHSFA
jgi:hypothetical protein